ncbi:hypothetical protein [Streptomyces acidiscabies]|uniref:Secreted protein n=1 Tax=Streptomyces acidiscabies TaxID=42234 RepID=A0A0L0K9P2_9ACTN|nr:hypothetical protein [Streptomyces acidiscabies]KND34360.1 hypothetical protein IQ63_16640 [Streptomyces acidiscabies]
MSDENAGDVEETRAPEVVPGDDSGSPAEKPARRGRTRVVLGSALLAAVVLAGAGYTVVTVRGAERDPGAARWEFPKPVAAPSEKPAEGSLRALFVPYGTDGFRPGPDLESYGHDTEFTDRQATALRAQRLKDMPRKYRETVEKHRIKSLALRTYLSAEANYLTDDTSYLVQVELTRYTDRGTVRLAVDGYRSLVASGYLDKGPVIKGHKDVTCFVTPNGKNKDTLDSFQCTAGVGDLVVALYATGSDPLDTKGVAAFVAKQLDRIGDAGRSV